MTDAEIKQAMRAIAAVNGLPLTDERIERDFATYKSYLTAIENIARVELPVEAEPKPIGALKRVDRR
jgi:hypothetical protein